MHCGMGAVGAKIFIVGGTKKDDSTIEVAATNVGRDSFTPPMCAGFRFRSFDHPARRAGRAVPEGSRSPKWER
jgi:hypothetical protein